MNLLLSKRGDYVVRSALSLARAYENGSQRKIREVVAEMGVPQTYASQILNDLVKTGIAESKSGKEGGYKLTKSPDKIKMIEIIEAGEGPLKADSCSLGDGPCRWDSVCPLHDIWSSATAAVRKILEQTTLQDLLDKDKLLESGSFSVPETTHRKVRRAIDISDWIQIEKDFNSLIKVLNSETVLTNLFLTTLTDIDSLRFSLNALLPSWEPSKLDCVVKPATKDAISNYFKSDQQLSDDKDDKKVKYFGISFEAITVSNLNIHADLISKAVLIDDDRCELYLKGSIRIPDYSESFNLETQRKLSNALIRTVLRKLAADLEAG